MKKKIILFSVIFIILIAAQTAAQDQLNILEIENSFVMGYSFLADDIAQTHRIGINYRFSDSITAGFIYQQAGINYAAGSLLLFRYTIAQKLGIGIMIGDTANTTAGLDISYDVLTNEYEGLSVVLRLNLEYLIPNITTGAIENGIAAAAISLGLGI